MNTLMLLRHAMHPDVLRWYATGEVPRRGVMLSKFGILMHPILGPLSLLRMKNVWGVALTENQFRAVRSELSESALVGTITTTLLIKARIAGCVAISLFLNLPRLLSATSNRRVHLRMACIILTAQYSAWSKVFCTLKPDRLITSSNFGFRTSPLLFAARDAKIELVYRPHSRHSSLYKPFLQNEVWLFKEDEGRLKVDFGSDIKCCFLSEPEGNTPNLHDPGSRNILVCLSLMDCAQEVHALARLIESCGYEAYFKPHPRERRRNLIPNSARRINKRFEEIDMNFAYGVASVTGAYFDMLKSRGEKRVFGFNMTAQPFIDVYEEIKFIEKNKLAMILKKQI